jgi:hypothetical protein
MNFMTFHSVRNFIILTDEYFSIFQRGTYTTNQRWCWQLTVDDLIKQATRDKETLQKRAAFHLASTFLVGSLRDSLFWVCFHIFQVGICLTEFEMLETLIWMEASQGAVGFAQKWINLWNCVAGRRSLPGFRKSFSFQSPRIHRWKGPLGCSFRTELGIFASNCVVGEPGSWWTWKIPGSRNSVELLSEYNFVFSLLLNSFYQQKNHGLVINLL